MNVVAFYSDTSDATAGWSGHATVDEFKTLRTLLGDAAHATLPHIGQGAGMAVEDGGALGCLLPAETRKDIPARLKAYEELRKERGEFIRAESVDHISKTTS
ncbi:hypothetical protein FB45DRAFT_924030 [Roridomyces roridus]|uniref:FAD-binding domain-containing protein n=1 Tax=Roridomyces roridus TaxID=1738132 RepID=A0AAD7BLG8_9AGAR|nr:hypothetical protein FB45DRAFT_924030 [Roridomyces roridus]